MQLDVEAVIKVSQALSQEIILEKLLNKIIAIIVENTAAERVYIIAETEKQPATWQILT